MTEDDENDNLTDFRKNISYTKSTNKQDNRDNINDK